VGNEEKGVFNTMVREYCRDNGKALFDIADIESHDTLGNPVKDVDGFEAMWHDYSCEGTLPNRLGQRRVASALWFLWASVLGWDQGVEEQSSRKSGFSLEFESQSSTGSTFIRYELPEAAHVKLSIFDAAGRQVASLVDGFEPSGAHTVAWNGSSPGVYFLRLESPHSSLTGKTMILK